MSNKDEDVYKNMKYSLLNMTNDEGLHLNCIERYQNFHGE